jgi:hypothetical protein
MHSMREETAVSDEHMKEARGVRSQFNRYLYTSGTQEEQIDAIIAAALLSAEQRGRQQGVEGAARTGCHGKTAPCCRGCEAAIRALAPLPPALPDEAVEKLVEAAQAIVGEEPGHYITSIPLLKGLREALAAVRAADK